MKQKKFEKILNTCCGWINTNVILVIAPTLFAYLYDMISHEKFPDITVYYDSIILIIFSVSCNLYTVCSDIRSNSMKKIIVNLIKKISFIFAIFYGGFHFHIIALEKLIVSNKFLIFSLVLLILDSILGCIFANHHTIYNVYIVNVQKEILNKKINRK